MTCLARARRWRRYRSKCVGAMAAPNRSSLRLLLNNALTSVLCSSVHSVEWGPATRDGLTHPFSGNVNAKSIHLCILLSLGCRSWRRRSERGLRTFTWWRPPRSAEWRRWGRTSLTPSASPPPLTFTPSCMSVTPAPAPAPALLCPPLLDPCSFRFLACLYPSRFPSSIDLHLLMSVAPDSDPGPDSDSDPCPAHGL